MTQIINIYCDESCHLENDGQPVMGFGAVICSQENLAAVNAALAALKEKHRARGELKWEKVSPARLAFYEELIDWFFAEPNLRFRGWLVDHKSRLAHDFFNAGSHDSFYYKMYYYLLEPQVRWPQPGEPERTYRIYLDVKDTRSRIKVKSLCEVLRNKKHDWNGKLVSRLQSAHAAEVQLMQLTDFLLGALTYRNRPLAQPGGAKVACVERMEKRAGFLLTGGTPPWEEKLNFYTFTPREIRE
jgi:hypothetical protein